MSTTSVTASSSVPPASNSSLVGTATTTSTTWTIQTPRRSTKWIDFKSRRSGALSAPWSSQWVNRVLVVGVDSGHTRVSSADSSITTERRRGTSTAMDVGFAEWEGERISSTVLPVEYACQLKGISAKACRWLGTAQYASKIYSTLQTPLFSFLVATLFTASVPRVSTSVRSVLSWHYLRRHSTSTWKCKSRPSQCHLSTRIGEWKYCATSVWQRISSNFIWWEASVPSVRATIRKDWEKWRSCHPKKKPNIKRIKNKITKGLKIKRIKRKKRNGKTIKAENKSNSSKMHLIMSDLYQFKLE